MKRIEMLWVTGRREFLVRMLEGLALLLAGVSPELRPDNTEASLMVTKPNRSKVVSIHHPRASAEGAGRDNVDLDSKVVRDMVNAGILYFLGESDLVRAWRKIIPDPTKKVAIKVNCQICGIYTKARVVQPVVDGLLSIGVQPDNIVIYDMTDNAFELAGFNRNSGPGIKVGTVAEFGGYPRFLFHRLANLLTGGYTNSLWNHLAKVARESSSGVIRFMAATLLGGREKPWDCEYLINIPVLKALDGYCGVTLSMKNHYGSIANPGEHHKDIMDHIPLVNNLPEIRKKTRLVVMDAIFCEFKWINGRDQKYVSRVNKILVSTDPVAMDKIGWGMIEALRSKHGLGPVVPKPVYMEKAASMGVGVADISRIDFEEIRLA